ncbi:MAG: helix-turn-helix transcriptional regulator [Phascolarctobacterium sp.]|nr:helix-turn-helix transcriptional regulator [Phascolarctobacterium sp.]
MMKYVKDNERNGYIQTKERQQEKPKEAPKSCALSASELYGKCLGKYLEEQLWEKDMKIKDLACKSGVTTRTISRILHASCEPCRDTLLRLYTALNVSPLEVEQSIAVLIELEKKNPEG